jgi:predicted Zn-dependent peptidase
MNTTHSASHASVSHSLPVVEHTLSNGLRVVVIPKHTAPVVALAVAYRVGSYYESPTNTGFAHLFEHLMFEGSENVAHGMFDKYCSEAGGENNAYTTYDKTTYYMTLPAHQMELGLWLEADRMGAFGITQEALDVQRNVVLEEINQNVENQPYGRLSRVQNHLAFRSDSGYHWEVYGNPAHIAASTLADVQTFYTTFYRPDNACLVLCGALVPDEALMKVEHYFGDIPRGSVPIPRRIFTPEQRITGSAGKRYERVEDAVAAETLFLSFHGEGFLNEAEVSTAEILCSILSDGASSRLYKQLAYIEQSASDINAYVDDRQFSSLFTIYAVANAAAAEKVVTCDMLYDSVYAVLDDVVHQGVRKEELTKAQNRISTRLARTLQRANGIADEAAHQAIFFDNPARVFSLMQSFYAVTVDDIRHLAQKLFRRENEIRLDFVPKKELPAVAVA